MTIPKISVVCVYNDLAIFQNVLSRSLRSQEFRDFELISLDNRGSKYDSAAAAYNAGARLSNAEVTVFVHQDVQFYRTESLGQLWEYTRKLCPPGSRGTIGVLGARTRRGSIG